MSTVLRCSGAAFWCWLGTWLYTVLLCCYGPCPHDPRRCGLNSCPSHTPMPCAILPQFANFPLVKSTVLPCNCIGLRSSLEFGCHPPSCGLGATVGWVGVPTFFPDLRRTLPQAAGGAKGTTLEPHSVVPHARAGWWRTCSLLLQAQCRQSFVAAVGQHSVAG